MARPPKFTGDQRFELVCRLIRGEASASELAQEASISEATLYKWRDKFLRGARSELGEESNDIAAINRQHAKEIAKREQMIGELTVSVNILKKTKSTKS